VELATGKPTIVADPYQKKAYSTHDEVLRLLKRRWASIIEGRKAESFGIIIGLKAGQKRVESAFDMKAKLIENGKRVTLLAAKEITPSILMQFPSLDAYVNTSCPRISLDDSKSFHKPILTLDEALVMLGNTSWEKLCRKGWFEN
jgi:2-(3-amino-3-carboxypropyl)histidine synthase